MTTIATMKEEQHLFIETFNENTKYTLGKLQRRLTRYVEEGCSRQDLIMVLESALRSVKDDQERVRHAYDILSVLDKVEE